MFIEKFLLTRMYFKSIFDQAVADHLSVVQRLPELYSEIVKLATLMRDCISNGGKVIWMGNGGSAADSQHLAAEIVGRFKKERMGMASIALTTDSSIITSVGNDYGFEAIFSRQVEAIGKQGDILVGITTTGNSGNVVAAINSGKKMGLVTVGMLGNDGGKLKSLCDHSIIVPSVDTARIQESHILIGHILCEFIEVEDA
jgi:D-sedoheptulose 7-phosphate isomerase